MQLHKAQLLVGAGCLLGAVGFLAVLEASRPVVREVSKATLTSVASGNAEADQSPGVVDVTLNPHPPSYTLRDQTSNQNLMARFADAVSLPRVEEGTEDELRVLYQHADFGETPVGVSLEGYVVRKGMISTCEVRFGQDLEDPLAGTCKTSRALEADNPLADLSSLASLSGRDYFCGVLDGYWLTIEGRYEGKYFVLSASNPDECENDGSKSIVKSLAGLTVRSETH